MWKVKLALLASIFGLVGAVDYHEQEEARDYYCEMVQSRLWPDYKGIYSTECEK